MCRSANRTIFQSVTRSTRSAIYQPLEISPNLQSSFVTVFRISFKWAAYVSLKLHESEFKQNTLSKTQNKSVHSICCSVVRSTNSSFSLSAKSSLPPTDRTTTQLCIFDSFRAARSCFRISNYFSCSSDQSLIGYVFRVLFSVYSSVNGEVDCSMNEKRIHDHFRHPHPFR